MKNWDIYHRDIPDFMRRISETPAMQRLGDVGMNCGCEYTSFPLFRELDRYTRLDHSIGAGLIVWHFTSDIQQSIAALLHDIATPAFAHVIDFLHGDHVLQESTEDATLETISRSREICSLLSEYSLTCSDVADYHLFPIADNDTPRLSSDRLEYTIGNMVNYGFATKQEASGLYGDLIVATSEEGVPELAFTHLDKASRFAELSLQCSKVYVCDEDRCAMQMLAELLKEAICRGVLKEEDLYLGESEVIARLEADEKARMDWGIFRNYSSIAVGEPGEKARIIQAKKRCIDPLVAGKGRVTQLDENYRRQLDSYLSTSFDHLVTPH